MLGVAAALATPLVMGTEVMEMGVVAGAASTSGAWATAAEQLRMVAAEQARGRREPALLVSMAQLVVVA